MVGHVSKVAGRSRGFARRVRKGRRRTWLLRRVALARVRLLGGVALARVRLLLRRVALRCHLARRAHGDAGTEAAQCLALVALLALVIDFNGHLRRHAPRDGVVHQV